MANSGLSADTISIDRASVRSTAGWFAWLPKLDAMGIALSGLCAVHCAALPVLMLAMPMVGSHEFETALRWILGGLGAVIVGAGAFNHRNFRALPLLAVALVLLSLCGQHEHGALELWLSLAASAFLISAHLLNTAACRAARNTAA